METFGKRVKRLMKKSGVTVRSLSSKANIPRSSLSDYLNDVSQPPADVLLKLSRFFDVSTDYLLTGVPRSYLFARWLDGIIDNGKLMKYLDYRNDLREKVLSGKMSRDQYRTQIVKLFIRTK